MVTPNDFLTALFTFLHMFFFSLSPFCFCEWPHSLLSTHRFPCSLLFLHSLSSQLSCCLLRGRAMVNLTLLHISRQARGFLRGLTFLPQHQCTSPPAKAGHRHEKRAGGLRVRGLKTPKSELAGPSGGPKPSPKRQSSPQSSFRLQRPCQQYFKFSQEAGAR